VKDEFKLRVIDNFLFEMKKKDRKLAIRFIIIIAISLLLIGSYYVLKPKKGELFESYVFEGSNLNIRVEARHQQGLFLFVPGAYYDYEAKSKDSDVWKPIFTILFDDPVEIPKDQIKEIKEQVVYLFIGWIYSVTTDGGKTWHTWNGSPKWAQYTGSRYGFIDEIQMDPNGLGVMSIRDGQGDLTELNTKDFGKTWERLQEDSKLSLSIYQ
jgi:hypothetical protein